MRRFASIIIAIACITGIAAPAHAAKANKTGKASQSAEEKLVLMPLRVPEEDKSLQGAMETALVEGLQQKYVWSGQ